METERDALERIHTEIRLYVNEWLFQRGKITEDTCRRARTALLRGPAKAVRTGGGVNGPEKRKGGTGGTHGSV